MVLIARFGAAAMSPLQTDTTSVFPDVLPTPSAVLRVLPLMVTNSPSEDSNVTLPM